MKIRNIFFAVLMLFLVGCTGEINEDKFIETTTETAAEPVTETTTLEPAQVLLNSMTLHEKAGQLFIVTPEALSAEKDCVTAVDDDIIKGLGEYPVGGVILFSQNIANPDQLTVLLRDFQTNSKTALFTSVDEEGGSVARVANNDSFDVIRYKSAVAVGKDEQADAAYSMGKNIGAYLKEYGFNLDFAPVADVNTNPDNPVIGERAFSSDPQVVADKVAEVINGFHDSGIMCCEKHFPGHGDTATDSHYGCAVTYKTREEMLECEWLPYIGGGVPDMVMAGHITTPNVTDDGLPASLSEEMINGYLREALGYFDCVVITDSMSMGAITNYFTADKAAVMAIKAGADIVLMPQDLQLAYSGIEQAVENGEITEEEIDEHVLRILRLKQKYGLIK